MLHQSGHPVHGQVGVNPWLCMPGNAPPPRALQSQVRPGVMPPPNPNSQAKAASHGGKKEVHRNPSNIDVAKSTQSHYKAKEHFSRCGVNPKNVQYPSTNGMIQPGGLDSKYKDDVELRSRQAAVAFKRMSNKLVKKLEENGYIRQISKLEDDGKQKKQCGKSQSDSDEATDVCAGKPLQKETKELAEQSNADISVLEDCKNRVKEVANLLKFHINSKHEGETCADIGKQLMKVHEELLEMKKRHQEEEQELHKQYEAAVRPLLLKESAADYDSDASDVL